jgi:hypothetical protein
MSRYSKKLGALYPTAQTRPRHHVEQLLDRVALDMGKTNSAKKLPERCYPVGHRYRKRWIYAIQ